MCVKGAKRDGKNLDQQIKIAKMEEMFFSEIVRFKYHLKRFPSHIESTTCSYSGSVCTPYWF